VQLLQPPFQEALVVQSAQLVVISFAGEERLRHWVSYFQRQFLAPAYASQGLAVPDTVFERTYFLADPSRAVYHAYGLGRNSIWRVYGPRILWQYALW
jgi:hypothetical protein